MIRSFDGKTPKIAESAFVSEAAYVIGDVEIGECSGVWPGAVIRADFGSIKIGNNTDIEDNCVLHYGPMEIGDDVVVGHSAVIEGRRIGSNVLIGNNATILPEVEIGDFCGIAAGSVVTEGMKIPDRSFVAGVPAKIKGEVSEAVLRQIALHSELYPKIIEKYKQQGL
jgi:carbonic anhydrase/acetyltransferase-like protein (isoleucine patch superfamily)